MDAVIFIPNLSVSAYNTYLMNQLNTKLTWGLISLQGILLLVDPEARNHIYNTFSAFNSVSLPFLQSFSENLRYIISLILIPTILYPAGWVIPKFVSLIAYVFFVSLHSNLIFYNKPTDIKYLLIQLLILGKALMILVDEMIENERSSQPPSSPRKVAQTSSKAPEAKPKQGAVHQSVKQDKQQKPLVDSKGKKKTK